MKAILKGIITWFWSWNH